MVFPEDSAGWLFPRTPGNRRLRTGVKYPGLISGALGGFITRHLYFNHFMGMGIRFSFRALSISNSVLPPS